MSIKGAVVGESLLTSGAVVVDHLVFTVAPVSGGAPINWDTTNQEVTIAYRDATHSESDMAFTATKIVGDGDLLLEEGELFEIDVTLTSVALGANKPFTVEVRPPTGAVIAINRTTPAAIAAVMELR
jgi:archaellin